MSRFKSIVALAAAATFATAVSACGSLGASGDAAQAAGTGSKGTITVRIPDPGNSGALALGKKDGSLAAALAKVGAKVEWTGTAGPFAPAAQELDANALDFAQGSITSVIPALSQKPGFKLFAAIAPDKLGEGILVKDDSGINSVADLVGKKVAVNQGGTGEYLLLKALAQANIPADKVQRVYLAPPQTGAVFHSGKVDAWATWSSYSISERANFAEHFVASGGQIGSQNYSIWTVRTGFVDAHPAVVKAFYDYLHQADAKVAADPEKYINVVRTSGPDAYTGKAKELEVADLKALAPTSAITAEDKQNFAQVAQFFADAKVTPSAVDVAPWIVDVDSLQGQS